jgi:hypothetical protein
LEIQTDLSEHTVAFVPLVLGQALAAKEVLSDLATELNLYALVPRAVELLGVEHKVVPIVKSIVGLRIVSARHKLLEVMFGCWEGLVGRLCFMLHVCCLPVVSTGIVLGLVDLHATRHFLFEGTVPYVVE